MDDCDIIIEQMCPRHPRARHIPSVDGGRICLGICIFNSLDGG